MSSTAILSFTAARATIRAVSGPLEKPLEREDVSAILTVLFDIKVELVGIRRALEDGNGEEEAEDDA